MQLQRGVDPTLVNQNAKHKLFVEGKDNQEIDPVAIKHLLENNDLTAIGIESMGGCDNVRSAAQALIYQHPSYYFLIDRDDQSQKTVDKSWQSFPDPDKYNMLIWHKRELENYFIDPEYILQVPELLKPDTDIRQIILNECNGRLFLDAANLTLLSIFRELRKPLSIEHFRNQQEFKDQEAGLLKLKSLSPRIDERKVSMTAILDENTINGKYQDFIEELSGGCIPLKYSLGSWLERMSGKEVFRVIANRCFLVKDLEGNIVQGKEQHKAIAKQLVGLPLESQPTDFQKLVNLLKKKVNETS
jgi:hypothetical protein